MVDALDSKSSIFGCASSSLARATKKVDPLIFESKMIEREYFDIFSTKMMIEATANKVVRVGVAGEAFKSKPSSLTTYFIQQIKEYILSGILDSKKLLEYCDHSVLTPFQKEIFTHLNDLKKGEVVTYKELSMRAKNSPNYSRAIGNALNKNPFLFIIPCHRVVSSSSPGGFALGLEFKKRLLSIENCNNYQLNLN